MDRCSVGMSRFGACSTLIAFLCAPTKMGCIKWHLSLISILLGGPCSKGPLALGNKGDAKTRKCKCALLRPTYPLIRTLYTL